MHNVAESMSKGRTLNSDQYTYELHAEASYSYDDDIIGAWEFPDAGVAESWSLRRLRFLLYSNFL